MNKNHQKSVRARLASWFTPVRLVGLFIGVLGLSVSIFGTYYRGEFLFDFVQAFYANFATECVSIAVTIVLIDWLYEMRDERREKDRLVREMRNPDHGVAMRAVEELRAQGWLNDRGVLSKKYLWDASLKGVDLSGADLHGSYFNRANLSEANLDLADLYGAHLMHANLEEAHLDKANLERADLHNAVLRGARLIKANLRFTHLHAVDLAGADLDSADMTGAEVHDTDLAAAYRLRKATMPDGKRYNGRFNLSGDIETARREQANPDDPSSMAGYYGVSLEDYKSGSSTK